MTDEENREFVAKLLRAITDNGPLSAGKLVAIVGEGRKKVDRTLSALAQANTLIRFGKGRSARWGFRTKWVDEAITTVPKRPAQESWWLKSGRDGFTRTASDRRFGNISYRNEP